VRLSKSDSERAYFDRFRRTFGGPPGVPTYDDRPDVIVRGETTIGVEITRLPLRGGELASSEQRQRPLREEIVAEAQSLFRAGGGLPIEWAVGFREGVLERGKKTDVARALANFALAASCARSGVISRSAYESTLPEIGYLYVNRTEYADPLWRVIQVHSVGLISPTAVQAVIAQKDAKAQQYAPCDELWLLIVVEPMDPAQEQEIRLDGIAAHSAVFDRVIVYKPIFEHIVDIELKSTFDL
jgi:hypothetical protein